jgi:hypothetical protein
MNKDYDKIAAVEKAIKEKYGEDAITNPRSNWDESKEKEYLKQMKELYAPDPGASVSQEKVDVLGIKVSKKLLNRESLKNCPICGAFPKKTMDDVCLVKYECCSKCYIQYVDGREDRWLKGWRPDETN